MIEIALAFLIGMVGGIATGMIPGINITAAMFILYPILLYFDASNILIIYITLGACVNYFASVSGTFFGVIGSPTAIPAMTEGHALFKKGQGDKAIMHAAIGSFIGSMTALLITFALLEVLFVFYNLFDTRVKLVIFFFAIVIFVTTSNNKKWVSFAFLTAGLVLGHVGYREETMQGFMVFGNTHLYSGLPMISVIFGLFVVPNLILSMESNQKKVLFTRITYSGYMQNFKEMMTYKWIIFRSSVLGYVTGFIPGITYVIGVIFSYSLVKQKKQNQNTYEKGDLHSLVASECANSAGTLSVILPLLLIGIPITGSQSLIYNIAMNSGIELTMEYFQSLYPSIIVAYIATSIICVFISGKYVNWISFVGKLNFNHIYIATTIILCVILFTIGGRVHQEYYYLIVFLALLPIGYLLRKCDITPAIYGFILSDNIFFSIKTMLALLQ